jgi:hypothetical protein
MFGLSVILDPLERRRARQEVRAQTTINTPASLEYLSQYAVFCDLRNLKKEFESRFPSDECG